MHKRQLLTLNVFFVFLSEVITRIVSAVMLFLVSLNLGPQGAGVYSIGTSLLFLGSRLSFWGLDQILIRDVARVHGLAGKYVTNFLLLRTLLSGVVGAILSLLLWTVLPYAPESRWPLSVIVWGLLPENISDICRAVFLAEERTQYVLLTNGMTAAIRIGGALLAAAGHYGATGFAWALSGGGALGAICAVACVWRHFPLGRQHLSAAFWRDELVEGMPFWIINLVNILDAQLDTLLLSWLTIESEVGLYGAGLGIMLALGVLPTTFRLALFPLIARLFATDQDALKRLYRKSLGYLFMIGAPISVGLFLTAGRVIQLIYRDAFAGSVPVLRVLCWSMLLLLPGDVDTRLLIASHNQRRSAVHTAAGLTVNVILNLLLVPRMGIVGAASARLASNLTIVVINHVFVQRQLVRTNILSLIWRPALATGMMGIAVLSLGSSSLGLAIVVGSITYVALVFALRMITPSEVADWLCPGAAFQRRQ